MVPHAAKQASAGVFRRSDGALVRTLWHNNTGIPPRTRLEVTWDGRLDGFLGEAVDAAAAGAESRADAYDIRVQVSNVTYTWQGVLGNSGPAVGPNVITSLTTPTGMATAGNIGVIVEPEGEGIGFATDVPT